MNFGYLVPKISRPMSFLTGPFVGCIGREHFFLLVRVYAGYRNDYRFVAEIALEAKVVRGHLFLQ